MTPAALDWDDVAGLSPIEAAALFVERSQRDEAPIEDALLDRWLSASEENRRAWSSVRDAWDFSDAIGDDSAFASMRAAALRARPERHRPAWIPYAAAASLLACVGSFTLIELRRGSSSDPSSVVAQLDTGSTARFGRPDFSTGQGQTTRYALPDGSRVTLSPDSAVDIAYSDGKRLARLVKGRAAFDVHHDQRSPFRVAIGDRVVSDVGTYFITSLDGSQVRVALIRGSVAIARGNDPRRFPASGAVFLKPGQEFVANAGETGRVQASTTPGSRPMMVTFENERLVDAVARMNLYSDDKMIVSDPKVASLRISGSFKTGDSATFARTLSELFPVRIERFAPHTLRIVRSGR
ncbi:FecR family protein [Sphingomonas glacialis]|nr:FecR domain-containing protein [Sphingomonas glacialis]